MSPPLPAAAKPPLFPRRVTAFPSSVRIVRVVFPVLLFVYRFVFAQSSPRCTAVEPQLPYTFDPWRVAAYVPVRGLYACATPRAPYGPYAAAPRAYVPVRGL